MRAPELFEMKKHVVNNRIIVKINYIAEKICLRILIARYPVQFISCKKLSQNQKTNTYGKMNGEVMFSSRMDQIMPKVFVFL